MPRLSLALLAAGSAALASGCAASRPAVTPPPPMLTGAPGRLAFPAPPPDAPPPSGLSPGVHRLASESGTAYLYVPGERPGPRPLLVVFHGAGGEARWMIDRLSAQAEARGVLLLAPQSAGPTWDLIRGEYGVDAAVLQQMLTVISTLFQVDPSRIGAAGFSDGASYALSLGLDNGDVFSSVMAFSPGFATLEHRKGSPRVFVSHGTADQVLNVDACGRAVVKRLRELGYGVTYQEFDGKHTLPPEVAAAATEWFTGS